MWLMLQQDEPEDHETFEKHCFCAYSRAGGDPDALEKHGFPLSREWQMAKVREKFKSLTM